MGEASPKGLRGVLALLGANACKKGLSRSCIITPLEPPRPPPSGGEGSAKGASPCFPSSHHGKEGLITENERAEGSLSGSAGWRYTWVFCGAQSVQTDERGRPSHGPFLPARWGSPHRCREAAIPDRLAGTQPQRTFSPPQTLSRFSSFLPCPSTLSGTVPCGFFATPCIRGQEFVRVGDRVIVRARTGSNRA